VWICRDPLGHLQATGVDASGRKQYRYHEQWRTRRDQRKFEVMREFAGALPSMRKRVEWDLNRDGMPRERVLACAIRLLDLGLFRIGGERYASENGTFGLATVRKDHVTMRPDMVVFDYAAKGDARRIQEIHDRRAREVIAALRRRRAGGPELLAFRAGRRWVDIRSADINEYVKEIGDETFSAKNFRTWNATVMAAVNVALHGRDAVTATARKRAISTTLKFVSGQLGNTPAICRASYVDPRVFDRYRSGWTIGPTLDEIGADEDISGLAARHQVEAAVLDLIGGETSAASLEKAA
jgi:DNA topoisomerase-1